MAKMTTPELIQDIIDNANLLAEITSDEGLEMKIEEIEWSTNELKKLVVQSINQYCVMG